MIAGQLMGIILKVRGDDPLNVSNITNEKAIFSKMAFLNEHTQSHFLGF